MNSQQQKCLALSKSAFERVERLLPKNEAATIREYIFDFDEWGLGLETLVDTLLDEDIAIAPTHKEVIIEAMQAMGLERSQRLIRVAD